MEEVETASVVSIEAAGRGGRRYELIEDRREDGRMRWEVLVELGDLPMVDEGLEAWACLAEHHRRRVADTRRGADLIGDGRAEGVSRCGRRWYSVPSLLSGADADQDPTEGSPTSTGSLGAFLGSLGGAGQLFGHP
jgi:hypothetical protein